MIDRRAFLATAPAAVLAVGPLGCRATPTPRPAGRVGVQLYTLRGVMAEDPDRTLSAIAEIGYEEVELAGLYGMSAAEMRAKLDAVGLRAASSHHGIRSSKKR